MIPQETVNLILDTARIDEVIGDFVTLKRRGASLVACCPFHNEKTPSFYVTPSKGIFKCFGCGKAGSAVGFVMEHEHLSYVEALKYLAHKYHIEVKEKEETAEDIALKQKNESLMLVMDFAQKFYVDSLNSPENRPYGLAYLHSRGLDDETIARFGLGWAPLGHTSLLDAAVSEGFKTEYLDEAGLISKRDDGRMLDRFYERAMFPIHSLSGRVIAYSGRTLKSDGIPKYVNSPETPLYVKSRALYGIYLAKAEISKTDKCYLAEGNVDVVSMHQLGITNVVASCGTSLTVEQIRIIKKFTDNVTVMYDGDAAGIHAAQRAIGMILKEDMNVRLVLFPDGDDPDSYCRKHTLEEVQAFIAANETDFVSYMIRVNPLTDSDPLKRAGLVNLISDTIAFIPDPVKRSVFIDSLSESLGIERSIVFNRIKGERRQMAEDERKESERARRREEAGLNPAYDTSQEPAPAVKQVAAETFAENRIVLEAEKELLRFLLCYGTDILDFASDSEYYSGDESEKPLVADFIRCSLEADETEFLNSSLRSTYNAYMEEYDKGYAQDEIIRTLLNSPDRTVASVAADLSMEKHLLTVKNFEDALTTTSSWLVNFVPKAILVYADRRLENELDKLVKSLESASEEEQLDAMITIQKLKAAQKKVKIKIGRER
ncbi:MAG: DNA primase [Bacteroidia bacterium]|nr:DNA primase [Bacteroidia bacterium]